MLLRSGTDNWTLAGSYLVLHKKIDKDTAAFFAGMFFIGITVGRAINGFLNMKFDDIRLIRLGQGIIVAGIFIMILPFGTAVSLIGFIMIGLDCAPIYPCLIHSTPKNFGEDKSQAIIGVQMTSAYVGNIVMPPFFGLIAENVTIRLLPVYLLAVVVLMFFTHSKMIAKCKNTISLNYDV